VRETEEKWWEGESRRGGEGKGRRREEKRREALPKTKIYHWRFTNRKTVPIRKMKLQLVHATAKSFGRFSTLYSVRRVV